MTESRRVTVHDVTHRLPHNPNYPSIPKRLKPATMIVWHCDDACNWAVEDLISYDWNPNHISEKGCPCPTYAYYITRDGTVFKTAEENWLTWHVGVSEADQKRWQIPNWNTIALGICFGHKPSTEPDLTPQQYTSGLLLTSEIARRLSIDSQNVRGHRELQVTGFNLANGQLRKEYPGMGIDLDSVRRNIRNHMYSVQQGELLIEVDSVQA